jgi:hypothetical protein
MRGVGSVQPRFGKCVVICVNSNVHEQRGTPTRIAGGGGVVGSRLARFL